jgi:hypothetical protein
MELIQTESLGLSTYFLKIVPGLWRTTLRRNNRIFQHMTIPDIVQKVLGVWQIEADLKLSAQYLEHDQRRHGRQGSQSPEPKQDKRGQYCERQAYYEDADDAASEKELHDQRNHVHRKVDLRKERGLRAAIMKIVAHEACLLEIE